MNYRGIGKATEAGSLDRAGLGEAQASLSLSVNFVKPAPPGRISFLEAPPAPDAEALATVQLGIRLNQEAEMPPMPEGMEEEAVEKKGKKSKKKK